MEAESAPSFSIRRLQAPDAPEFRRVRLRGLAEHPEAFTSTVAEWNGPLAMFVERIEQAYVVGAFERESGLLRGHVILASHVKTSFRTRHKCDVWSVYVEPEARGNGLARVMMEAAIEAAREMGYDWVKLGVTDGNGHAKALYESLGFSVYGYEPDHKRLEDGRSFGEHLMQKRL